MVNLLKERLREAAVLLCVLTVAFVFASTWLRGQVRRGVDQIDSCVAGAQSPACLQSKIAKLEAQLGELQQQVANLQNKMTAVDSIGVQKTGKADGFDDVWTAIETLKNDVKELKKR